MFINFLRNPQKLALFRARKTRFHAISERGFKSDMKQRFSAGERTVCVFPDPETTSQKNSGSKNPGRKNQQQLNNKQPNNKELTKKQPSNSSYELFVVPQAKQRFVDARNSAVSQKKKALPKQCACGAGYGSRTRR